MKYYFYSFAKRNFYCKEFVTIESDVTDKHHPFDEIDLLNKREKEVHTNSLISFQEITEREYQIYVDTHYIDPH